MLISFHGLNAPSDTIRFSNRLWLGFHSVVTIALWIWSASAFISFALAVLPAAAYACAAARAPLYWYAASPRSILPERQWNDTASASLPVRAPQSYSMSLLLLVS